MRLSLFLFSPHLSVIHSYINRLYVYVCVSSVFVGCRRNRGTQKKSEREKRKERLTKNYALVKYACMLSLELVVRAEEHRFLRVSKTRR